MAQDASRPIEPAVLVRAAAHTDLAVATRIHAVQMRAYAQEARLLGAVRFPPLERDLGTNIASLVVDPPSQARLSLHALFTFSEIEHAA